jgi:mercuric ion binding protein
MKIHRMSLAAALAALVAAAPAWAESRTAKIGVDGMVCAFCAQGIEKKLKARTEVERIFVSLENKVVAVGFKDGRTIGDDELGRLIVDSGYKVTSIARVDDSVDAIRAATRKK